VCVCVCVCVCVGGWDVGWAAKKRKVGAASSRPSRRQAAAPLTRPGVCQVVTYNSDLLLQGVHNNVDIVLLEE
jgi:hypothetical protein